MFVNQPAPFIETYIEELDQDLGKLSTGKGVDQNTEEVVGLVFAGDTDHEHSVLGEDRAG